METKINNRVSLAAEANSLKKNETDNSIKNKNLNIYGESEKCKPCLSALINIKIAQINVKNFIDLINKKNNISLY